MFKSEYDRIVRENFDLRDRKTRKYIVALEDAEQEQLIAALSSALYDKIVSKVVDIDFGTIPMSRGDITKVQGFDNSVECLDIMRKLVIEYKQNPGIVNVVITAIENTKDRKSTFMKAYALNVELPIVIYNTVVLAIERSISLLISTCMEYIKDPQSNTVKAALDKVAYNKSMDDLLFKQLVDYNNMCNNKSLDKILDNVVKNASAIGARASIFKRRKRGFKEDVEMQYGVVAPIDDDEIFDSFNSSDYRPSDLNDPDDEDSPFNPDSTVEPYDGPNRPSPEPYDNGGGDEGDSDLFDHPEDGEEADYLLSLLNNTDDNVEPENIPVVVPGDAVTSDDQAITEYEDNESSYGDESDQDRLPVANNQEVGVDESITGALTLGASILATGGKVAALGAIGVAGIALGFKLIVSFLRLMVYTLYYTSFKLSDYLAVQADLIEANANELQYSTTTTLSDTDRARTVKKQLKFAQKLRYWSNKFNIDSKVSGNKAMKEIEQDEKNKYTIDPNYDDSNNGYDYGEGLF